MRRERDSNPWNAQRSTVFETAPFDHSGISPNLSSNKKQPICELLPSGDRGIRTPDTFLYNGFQDRRDRPLCHISAAKIQKFSKRQTFFSFFLFTSFSNEKITYLCIPIMKRALKNTNIITLILIALSFNCCKNASSRSEILDFQFSYNNRQDYIEKYVSLADNVDLSHAKDPDLLEKISQIYYLNGRELYNKKDYIEAANTLTKSYLAINSPMLSGVR